MRRDDQETRLVRRARALNAVIFGAGQLLLSVLVAVAAFELAPLQAPGSAVSPRVVVALLAGFALYAIVNGVRQLTIGLRGLRALRSAEAQDGPSGDTERP